MDLTKIKRQLAHASPQELGDVIRYCKQRQKVLADRLYAERLADAAERAATWATGPEVHVEHVWVHAQGTFVGGPFQRGDKLTVTHYQPRAKRLWVTFRGTSYWLDAKGINRYDLRAEPMDEKPMDDEHRASLDRMAGRLGQALSR